MVIFINKNEKTILFACAILLLLNTGFRILDKNYSILFASAQGVQYFNLTSEEYSL